MLFSPFSGPAHRIDSYCHFIITFLSTFPLPLKISIPLTKYIECNDLFVRGIYHYQQMLAWATEFYYSNFILKLTKYFNFQF